MAHVYALPKEKRERFIESLAARLEQRLEIAFAYIYGSFVEDRPFRDIDLGIYVTGLDEDRLTAYAIDLALELERTAGFPVDVRVLNAAPLSFLYHVFRGELVISRDDDLRARRMEDAVRHHLDAEPLVRRSLRELAEA